MVAVRERNPEKLGRSVRAAGYVRISAEKPLNSAHNQKAAIRRYAKTQNLHIALILFRPAPSQRQLIGLNKNFGGWHEMRSIRASVPEKTAGPPRAAQYVRMSTEHQQYSTENQTDAIRRYAEGRSMQIVRTYSDEGQEAG